MARLTAERVIDGAMELADEIGIDRFTIRRLATTLQTKPMTIYHHLPNKEAIIDGIIDRVFSEISLPELDSPWRDAIALRAGSMREVDSRTSHGKAGLLHHETMIGCLRNAGFSTKMIGHAMVLLDSYVYGFALQEAALPATSGDELVELAEDMMMPFDPGEYPNLVEFATEQVMSGEYDFADEFEFGLNLILDAFETQVA